MSESRLELYRDLEKSRGSKVIAYVTGDRKGLETQIGDDALDIFVNHLDGIGPTRKLTLVLYTRGGNTLTAWGIVNLLRNFSDELEVIVPSRAMSAGTLVCLGADNIVMTKQAMLSPIDPSVNSPLNPSVQTGGGSMALPLSVEEISAYIDFAQDIAGKESTGGVAILAELCSKVHPLALGQAYRSRSQIRMLAKKLIVNQVTDPERAEQTVEFLCSVSGSHDYSIMRREALEELGLNIEKPDDQNYELIKKLYDDIATELKLSEPYTDHGELGGRDECGYEFIRGFVESTIQRSRYKQTGRISKRAITDPRIQGLVDTYANEMSFEGWKNEAW